MDRVARAALNLKVKGELNYDNRNTVTSNCAIDPDRLVANLAVQPWLGILPERRLGSGLVDSDFAAAARDYISKQLD